MEGGMDSALLSGRSSGQPSSDGTCQPQDSILMPTWIRAAAQAGGSSALPGVEGSVHFPPESTASWAPTRADRVAQLG